MPNPPDEFFERLSRQYDRVVDARIQRHLDLFEAARLELQAAITGVDSFTQSHILRLIAELDRIIADTQGKLRQQPRALTQLVPEVKTQVETMLAAVTGQSIIVPFSTLSTDLLQRYADVELDKVTGMLDIQKRRIKSALFMEISVKGKNTAQVARKLVGKDSAFTKQQYHHVETILRTEANTIANQGTLASIRESNALRRTSIIDRPMIQKKIVEVIQKERNHPISLVLHKQSRPDDEPFEASEADIRAKARAIKHPPALSAIFWEKTGGVYRGMNLPAHYNERGRIVPYLPTE